MVESIKMKNNWKIFMPEDAAFNEMLSTLARDFLTPLPEFIVCFFRGGCLDTDRRLLQFPRVSQSSLCLIGGYRCLIHLGL